MQRSEVSVQKSVGAGVDRARPDHDYLLDAIALVTILSLALHIGGCTYVLIQDCIAVAPTSLSSDLCPLTSGENP